MKKIFYLLTFLLGVITFSQSKKDKVKELIYLSGTLKVSKNLESELFSIYRNQYKAVPEELWKSYEEKINFDDLIDEAASIFGSKFSDKEIDELYSFYNTDLGKKVFQNYPLISTDIQSAVSNWAFNFTKLVDNDLESKGYKKKSINTGNPPQPKQWK